MDDWCSKHEMPLECAACNGDMENLRDKAKEIASLRSQLEAERDKHAWIPVSVRLPKCGKLVLTITPGGTVQSDYMTTAHKFTADHPIGSDDEVSHWMPLPESP